MHIYKYIYVYILSMYIYTYIFVCIYVCTCMYICMYIYLSRPIEVNIPPTHSFLHNLKPAMIHRDVKPANVMITSDWSTVKLVDFGLVTHCNRSSSDADPCLARVYQVPLYLSMSHNIYLCPTISDYVPLYLIMSHYI